MANFFLHYVTVNFFIFDATCNSATGEARIQATVPDTITSWVATAFAMNENTGLGIVPRSAIVSFFIGRIYLYYREKRWPTFKIVQIVFK